MTRILMLISITAALACLTLLNIVYLDLPGTGATVISLQFAFTPEHAQKILSLWGSAGQQLFVNTIYLDYLFPFFYGIVLYLAANKIPNNKKYQIIALIAPIADMIENSFHVFFIQGRLPVSSLWVLLASLAATIKWVCILIIVRKYFKICFNNKCL